MLPIFNHNFSVANEILSSGLSMILTGYGEMCAQSPSKYSSLLLTTNGKLVGGECAAPVMKPSLKHVSSIFIPFTKKKARG